MMRTAYLNGSYLPEDTAAIPAQDCGFTTGIGVFDSLSAQNGQLIYAEDHFQRLMHDAQHVTGLRPDLYFEQWYETAIALLEKNALLQGFARIRTTITGGPVESPLAKAHTPTFYMCAGSAESPTNLSTKTCMVISDFPRIAGCNLENCKRLDYTRSYAARMKAKALGADEAILTNTDGNIACGATSNIFILENNALVTPPLSDGILAGITRKKILEGVIETPAQTVIEDTISHDRLTAANKVYLTNSFIGLCPVKLLDRSNN